jgi:hypothetical protein
VVVNGTVTLLAFAPKFLFKSIRRKPNFFIYYRGCTIMQVHNKEHIDGDDERGYAESSSNTSVLATPTAAAGSADGGSAAYNGNNNDTGEGGNSQPSRSSTYLIRVF